MADEIESLMLKQKNEWLDHEAPKIHSAFGLPPGSGQGSDQRAVQKQKKPVYDIASAVERYRVLEGRPGLTIDPTQCSWAEVFRLLSEAKRAYSRKGSGISGLIRKAFRSAGDHVDDIKPLIDLIPDEVWGSALRISLGWIFSLLATCAKNRENILAALENVPDIIVAADAKLKHFSGDVQVTELVYNLFDTIIEVTTTLLTYLLPKHQISKVFPWLSGEPPGSDISPAIDKIRRAVAALDQQSELLKESIIVDTNDHVHKASENVHRVQSELHVVRQGVLDVKLFQQQDSHAIREALLSSEVRIINAVKIEADEAAKSARQGLDNWCTDMIQRVFVPMIEARDHQYEMRTEYLLGRVQELELQERARTPQPRYGPTWNLSIPDAQNIIRAPFQVITRDFENVLRQGHQLDNIQQNQAHWVLHQDQLRQWMFSDSSDIVVVHGDLAAFSGDHQRLSSLSMVCATMAAGLIQTSPKSITLYYFCGLHMSSQDDLDGPQGLLRLLIGRLLLELDTTAGYKPNLESMDGSFIDGLQRRDIWHLCALLSSLLGMFAPDTTIYCMIDGITWYDRATTRNDFHQIMQTLRNLVAGPWYSRCQLKVLVTSPFRSTELTRSMPPHKQIVLESETMMLEASSGQMLQGELSLVETGLSASRHASAQTHECCSPDEEIWTEDDYA